MNKRYLSVGTHSRYQRNMFFLQKLYEKDKELVEDIVSGKREYLTTNIAQISKYLKFGIPEEKTYYLTFGVEERLQREFLKKMISKKITATEAEKELLKASNSFKRNVIAGYIYENDSNHANMKKEKDFYRKRMYFRCVKELYLVSNELAEDAYLGAVRIPRSKLEDINRRFLQSGSHDKVLKQELCEILQKHAYQIIEVKESNEDDRMKQRSSIKSVPKGNVNTDIVVSLTFTVANWHRILTQNRESIDWGNVKESEHKKLMDELHKLVKEINKYKGE